MRVYSLLKKSLKRGRKKQKTTSTQASYLSQDYKVKDCEGKKKNTNVTNISNTIHSNKGRVKAFFIAAGH